MMKSLFQGFYRPDDAAFKRLWDDAIFVLDANVLLNLYRYPRKARDELLGVFTRISGRLWVPYQAALEYQRNRPSVIAEQKQRFHDVRRAVNTFIQGLENEFIKLRLRERHALIDPGNLIAGLKEKIQSYLTELETLEQTQGNVHDKDLIREQIQELVGSRVGPRPTQDFINKVHELGEKRFLANTPPGFKDESKNKESLDYSYDGIRYKAKYGDLILWFQLIEFARTRKVPAIALVTDDQKEDWWWRIELDGKKTLGPRPELLAEIKEAGVEIFYMYNTASFLRNAKFYLNETVSDDFISQVSKELRELHPKRVCNYEQVTVEWLLTKYQSVSYNEGLVYSTLKGKDTNDIIGFDVVYIGDISFEDLILPRILAAGNAIQQGKVSRFELVVTTRVPFLLHEIVRAVKAEDIILPPLLSLTVGTFKRSKEGIAQFVPLYEFSG